MDRKSRSSRDDRADDNKDEEMIQRCASTLRRSKKLRDRLRKRAPEPADAREAGDDAEGEKPMWEPLAKNKP
eukprot:10267744-Heterocapsa_arctica.AAC.1